MNNIYTESIPFITTEAVLDETLCSVSDDTVLCVEARVLKDLLCELSSLRVSDINNV